MAAALSAGVLTAPADETGTGTGTETGAGAGTGKKRLKVLTIGNSFSNSVFVFLPSVVRAAGDCEIVMERASLGGCSLERHWKLTEQSEKDPSFKPYPRYRRNGVAEENVYSLRDLLKKHRYDVVTIQQASHDSWKKETYFPYAAKICEYVRKHSPGAKIMIQQTWSYRPDDPRLEEWGITPDEMYRRLAAAYEEAAEKLGIEIIPTGDAVEYARKHQKHKFKPLDWKKYMTLQYPDPLPDQTGSLINGFFYRKRDKSLAHDAFHLNKRGEYLQACVWFIALFDRPCPETNPKTAQLDPEDAAFLRSAAEATARKIRK